VRECGQHQIDTPIPIGIARVITGRLPAGVIAHQINNLLPGLVLMLGLLGVVPMT
jgi:hypothetical protein